MEKQRTKESRAELQSVQSWIKWKVRKGLLILVNGFNVL